MQNHRRINALALTLALLAGSATVALAGPTPPVLPASTEAKDAAEPATDVSALPAPTFGLVFDNDERIVHAIKLVEHGDFDQALTVINTALKDTPKKRSNDTLHELNLCKAMVLMRSGKVADGRKALSGPLGGKASEPDRSSRAPDSIVRRAQFLELAATNLPKVEKGELPPASKPEVWMKALEETAAEIATKHEKETKQFEHSVKVNGWRGMDEGLQTMRQLLEQLDCASSFADSSRWNDRTKAHGDAIERAVADLNADARKARQQLDAAELQMRESNLAPGWYPINTVSRYNNTIRDLNQAKELAAKMCNHYDNAQAKWNGGGAFNASVHLGTGFIDIPRTREIATMH